MVLKLEVAYVHCRKHFPRTDNKPVDWGTDDVKAKGGDYFGAKELSSPGASRTRVAAETVGPAAPGVA